MTTVSAVAEEIEKFRFSTKSFTPDDTPITKAPAQQNSQTSDNRSGFERRLDDMINSRDRCKYSKAMLRLN